MRRTPVAAALAAAALFLTACGSDDGGADTAEETSASTTTESGITVSGAPGEKPTLEIPDEDPPTELVVEVLDEGDGDEVGDTDHVVANYLGQTWEPLEEGEANVFDNSYDRGEPSPFPLDGVIAGWKEGLAGQQEGSRVLLTIPPELGYADQEQEAIPAGSTLSFVVEIVASTPLDATASGEEVTDLPDGLPTVTSEEGAAPTIDLEGATPPEESRGTLLIAGDGPEIADNIVFNVLQVDYPDGGNAFSSWDTGQLQTGPVEGLASIPGVVEALEGQTVGSRVLVEVSAADNPAPAPAPTDGSTAAPTPAGEGTPLAIVIDVVDTY